MKKNLENLSPNHYHLKARAQGSKNEIKTNKFNSCKISSVTIHLTKINLKH